MSNTAVQGLKKEDSGLNTSFRKIGASVAAAAQLVTASLPSAASLGVGAAALGVGTQRGDSAVVMTAADIPAAQALGAAQEDTVWIQGTAFSTVSFSGTLIRGRDHDYVVTAAHAISYVGGAFSPSQLIIGNGTSYINDRGSTTGANSIYVSPTFVPGSNSGLDYAFIQLTNRISSSDLTFSIAPTPTFGTSILFAGYGLPGTMSGEPVSNTGNILGFYGNYISSGPITWNSANDSGTFSGLNSSGYVSNGDSGGSVKSFNSATGKWENLGIITGVGASSSIFLNYNNTDSEFNNYLYNTVIPSVPEPSSVFLLAIGGGMVASYRRRTRQ